MAVLSTLSILGGLAGLALSADLTGYVLPKVGTEAGGNTFPGVTAPFGMVKLGPDLFTGGDSYSGYQPNGVFNGFSMLHESGTGGAPKYGVVSQMPVLGDIANPLAEHTETRASPDEAQVGYYKATLGSGITVELGATTRAGMYQYTFPQSSKRSNIIVDVSHVLPSFRGMGLGQNYLGGSIKVNSPEGGRMQYQGSGSYDNGWNRSPKWTVYFCGTFDAPGTSKTFLGKAPTGSEIDKYPAANEIASTTRLGAVFSFDTKAVTSRVGVSFISEAQACSNLDSQIPEGTSLATITRLTKDAWNTEILSKVTTTETNNATLQLLYTSLYHMNLLPTNKTGENPLWKSTEPYYDDTFTLWDLHRCTTSLFHIIHPVAYEEFVRSLIDIQRNEGYMPDARSSFFNGATQGGSNADNVLADAFVKGVRGKINWEDGFAAMVKDAEVPPPNNNDPRDPRASTKEGRGALPDWLQYGYITTAYTRSVSRAVEYSVNDFALHQVAVGLKRDVEANRYLNRSRNWRHHWNPEATALGFKGFVVPRTTTGFIAQDPLSCGGCYWGDHYYEALPWEYSFNAHHDINSLIELSGGDDQFVARLEATFTPGLHPTGSPAFGKTIFNPGNEPSFTTPFLYNFVNRQDLTVKQSRYIAKSYYKPTNNGLPGNSDAGAMESWILWVMMGLYPMTGQTTFLIGSPWFADLTLSLGGGKTLRITSTGGSDTSFFVQSLRVNGRAWNRAWLAWDDVFAAGGTLDFVLGPTPAPWTTGARPPSPASEGYRPPLPGVSTLGEVPDPNRPLMSVDEPVLAAALAGVAAVGMVVSGAWALVHNRRKRRARKAARSEAAAAAGGAGGAGVVVGAPPAGGGDVEAQRGGGNDSESDVMSRSSSEKEGKMRVVEIEVVAVKD